jgi:capsular exopolysaccharide synthesis family protein
MSELIASARTGRARTDYRETLDLREVINLFRNHFRKIFLCVTLCVVAAFFYLQNTHPIYASSALLEVNRAGSQGPAPTEIETSEMLKTVELKLASQSVLLAVIKASHLIDDPDFLTGAPTGVQFDPRSLQMSWQWLADEAKALWARVRAATADTAIVATPARTESAPMENAPTPVLSDAELVARFATRVNVHMLRGSRLISLRVEDRDPERAQQLAHAIVDEFFKQSREARTKDTSSTHELLQAEVKRVGDAYRSSQEKLEAYRAKYNAVSLAERQNIVVERLRELNQQVAGAKNVRLAREAELAQVKRFENAPPEQMLSIRSISEMPDILDARKQVTLKEAEVATLAQRYGPLHPTMVQQQSELAELRSSFHNAIRKAASRVRESYDSAKAVEHSLDVALTEQEKAALELDRIAIPYNTLEREAQANGETYRKLLDELNKLTVARGLTSNNDVNGIDIRIVEQPLVPVQPSRPRHDLLLAISAATGLFFGCGLALGARALDTSVTSVDSAEATLGLPVLATVPRSRHHRLSRRPLVLRYPASSQAEAFRSLRTALSLSGEEQARCVLFTSAMPGEGKTFCALNCAATYAQQGMRTLLIDADLRRPSVMPLFSDPNDRPSLSACLRDPNLFTQAAQPTGIENLYRIGNWRNEAGSAELMARSGMRELLERASASFNRIVIDSAPLMAVSDTLYLAQHVPTICLVVYAGQTPRRVAKRALKMLEEVSKRSATGLVLNKIKSGTSAEHYYYYNA